MQIRLRDYGVLDFDAGDARRQPPVDTTWQQVLDTLSSIILSFFPFFLFFFFNFFSFFLFYFSHISVFVIVDTYVLDLLTDY